MKSDGISNIFIMIIWNIISWGIIGSIQIANESKIFESNLLIYGNKYKNGSFREKDKSRYLILFIHDQLLLEKCIFVEAIINVYQK